MSGGDAGLLRLRRILDEPDFRDEWSGGSKVRKALTDEWALAKHVAEADETPRRKYVRNLEDTAESERRVRVDHAGRYPIELIQNAQDACADAGKRGRAWVRVTPTALIVGNEGVPFTADRIEALVRLGGTTKGPGDPQHHTIGYKGIGFTSVLDVSESPQVISRGVAFSLNRSLARAELTRLLGMPVSRTPFRYFPFPATPEDWEEDAGEVEEMLDAGAVTVIRLPFREGVDPEAVRQDVASLITPTTLLLMPALNGLDAGEGRCWTRRKGRRIAGAQLHHLRWDDGRLESWLVAQDRVPVAAEAVENLDDEVWAEVQNLHVLVGIPWTDGRPAFDPARLPPLHAYFPTKDTTGRGILIHGDFFLASNRLWVHAEGAAGVISDTVARGVTHVVGDLASSMCRDRPELAPRLLACLAERASPQGYGQHVAALLDEDLATRPILRTVGGDVVTPEEARIVGVEMPEEEWNDLATMLEHVDKLIAPEFEQIVPDWLEDLGATPLEVKEVVKQLEPVSGPGYSKVVRAVAAWWKAEARWSHGSSLQKLRFLRSEEGGWHRASELVLPVEGVPALPPGLEMRQYQPPDDPSARAFVEEELGIDVLDLDRAVHLVFSSLQKGTYGNHDDERKAAHDFARAAFQQDAPVVRKSLYRDMVPVPVRSWRRGPQSGWRKAGEVYFNRDWTGHPHLERLYRRFSRREFLAVDPPVSQKKRAGVRGFYRTLGVASEPRDVEESRDMWYAPAEWRKLKSVQKARVCPDGHPQTARRYEFTVLDRLPDLLDEIEPTEGRALAGLLSRKSDPFGPKSEIWCRHSSHHGRRASRSAIGYQRWLLESKPWLPVVGDPLGRGVVRPSEAWVEVHAEALRACLAQADIPLRVAQKLGLPSASRPKASAIVSALSTLKSGHPELSQAPDEVIQGAELLLKRLETALGRQKAASHLPPPPFPALAAGSYVWSSRPAVPDLPVPETLPVERLREGSWKSLMQVFALPPVSDLVAISTDAEASIDATLPGLDDEGRVRMTALLTFKGADLKLVARRLGLLEVRTCASLRTTYSASGLTVERTCAVHLDSGEDDTGTLHLVEPVDEDGRVEIARLLAEHLQAPEHYETILLSLVSLDANLLSVFRVSEAELDEARRAIQRYISQDSDAGPARDPQQQTPASTSPPPRPGDEETEPSALAGSDDGAGDRTEAHRPVRTTYAPDRDPTRPPASIEGATTFSTSPRPPAGPSGHQPSGARGGTGQSGYPSVTPEARRAVESSAIEVAKRYGRQELGCIEVRDVQDANKGWDLEFVFEDGQWWPIEVKGFGGSVTAFVLTRNELSATRREPTYRILLVTGVERGRGKIIELENPGEWLQEDEMSVMSWAVADWRSRITEAKRWAQDEES